MSLTLCTIEQALEKALEVLAYASDSRTGQVGAAELERKFRAAFATPAPEPVEPDNEARRYWQEYRLAETEKGDEDDD